MSINSYSGESGSCGFGKLIEFLYKNSCYCEKCVLNKGNIMATVKYEKSIKIPAKPAKSSIVSSYVGGSKLSKIPKPKSLTPLKKK